jgi:hypothetical protein
VTCGEGSCKSNYHTTTTTHNEVKEQFMRRSVVMFGFIQGVED